MSRLVPPFGPPDSCGRPSRGHPAFGTRAANVAGEIVAARRAGGGPRPGLGPPPRRETGGGQGGRRGGEAPHRSRHLRFGLAKESLAIVAEVDPTEPCPVDRGAAVELVPQVLWRAVVPFDG